MARMNSVRIVEDFRAAVWKARDPEAVDRFLGGLALARDAPKPENRLGN